MKDRIHDFILGCIVFYWVVVTGYRMLVLGRWFIFRDTPTWVLQEIADAPPCDDPADEEYRQWRGQALDELKLRRRVGPT